MQSAACQLPYQPRIQRSGQQLPLFDLLTHLRHVVHDPLQLRGGEIAVHDQPGALLDILPVLLCQCVRRGGGAAILPHDGGIYRFAGIPVPHQTRLSLIGKADAADLLPADTGVPHGLLRRFQQTVKDLLRDVLAPHPGLGKN